MAEDADADNVPKMIGLDMVLNMTDLDRAQEVWDLSDAQGSSRTHDQTG